MLLVPTLGTHSFMQTPGQIGNLLLCATLVNAIAYIAAPPFAIGVGAAYVIPLAAPLCFGVSLFVGPSPLLPQLPHTMPLQIAAWSASAFLFALNFPCGLVLWPSIVAEMGFSTDEVASIFGSIQVAAAAAPAHPLRVPSSAPLYMPPLQPAMSCCWSPLLLVASAVDVTASSRLKTDAYCSFEVPETCACCAGSAFAPSAPPHRCSRRQSAVSPAPSCSRQRARR